VILLYKELDAPITVGELKVCYYHISLTEAGMRNGGRSVTSQPPWWARCRSRAIC